MSEYVRILIFPLNFSCLPFLWCVRSCSLAAHVVWPAPSQRLTAKGTLVLVAPVQCPVCTVYCCTVTIISTGHWHHCHRPGIIIMSPVHQRWNLFKLEGKEQRFWLKTCSRKGQAGEFMNSKSGLWTWLIYTRVSQSTCPVQCQCSVSQPSTSDNDIAPCAAEADWLDFRSD